MKEKITNLSGNTFEVLPGDTIPLDGEILAGDTVVDESIITGESTPTPKKTGDTVLSGSINLSNTIKIKVTRTQANSTFNQIAEMVKKAQFSKPLIPNSRDKITSFPSSLTLVILIVPLFIIKTTSPYSSSKINIIP